MTEQSRTWIYTLAIISIFLLLGWVIWLWYDDQIRRLGEEQKRSIPVKETPLQGV